MKMAAITAPSHRDAGCDEDRRLETVEERGRGGVVESGCEARLPAGGDVL
jgi:hypothetical protein